MFVLRLQSYKDFPKQPNFFLSFFPYMRFLLVFRLSDASLPVVLTHFFVVNALEIVAQELIVFDDALQFLLMGFVG